MAKQLKRHQMLKRHKDHLTVLALSASTIATYYASLWYGFVFDDLPNITNNFAIKNPTSVMFFRSVRWLSNLLNKYTYKYWQLSPLAYRLGALAIHIATGITIFYITIKILSFSKENFLTKNSYIIATITSGLFLLHPVSTQTATYITQARLEGLATLFILLTLATFIAAASASSKTTKIVLYTASLTISLFATGTKETTILIPLLVLLTDWFFIASGRIKNMKSRIPIHIAFWIIVVGAFLYLNMGHFFINAATLKTTIENSRGNILTASATEKIKPLVYFMSQFKVILHYLAIFFWPMNISFDYDLKLANNFWSLEVLFPLFLLILFGGSALFLFIKNRLNIISFCIFWFFITILPRASIIPSTEFACDYKTYLPSFGILLLIAIAITKLINLTMSTFKTTPWLRPVSLSFFFISLSILSYNRNLVWGSRLNFWGDVIKHCPDKPRVLNNYAAGLIEAGRIKEAIQAYEKAIKIDPTYAEPVINLALQYQGLGKGDKALELYKKAMYMKEVHPELYLNIGSLQLQEKRYPQAEKSFKFAIKLNRYYDKAHFNLGLAYQRQNKHREAYEAYEKALLYGEESLQLNYVLGEVSHNLGINDKAIKHLEKVRKQNPNFLETAFILGSCYYLQHDYKNAYENFKTAYTKDTNSITYSYNLAQSLLNLERYQAAEPLFSKCKPAARQLPYTVLHHAKCLKMLGKRNQAKEELTSFIDTTKNKKVKLEAIQLLKSL